MYVSLIHFGFHSTDNLAAVGTRKMHGGGRSRANTGVTPFCGDGLGVHVHILRPYLGHGRVARGLDLKSSPFQPNLIHIWILGPSSPQI